MNEKKDNRAYSNMDDVFEPLIASLWGKGIQGRAIPQNVRGELSAQTVENLTLLAYPEDDNLKIRQVARFTRMVIAQDEVIKLLQEAHIPVVVIKGTSAGVYYPQPYLRTYGDIDLLVQPQNYYKAVKLLVERGWKQPGSIGEVDTELYKDDFLFELHQSVHLPDNLAEKDFIISYIRAGFSDIQEGYINQPSRVFPMLPWKQNGLELIWHFREHLYNGIGLRHAIDWMMFVHACLDDTAFVEYRDVLEKAGLLTLAKTVTRMCQIYLGLSESITWCKDASDELCKELMDYILEQGNFGHKRTDDKATKVLTRYRTPIAFLNGMQRKGLEEWRLCKTHRILRPFAWMYTAVEGIKYLSKRGLSKMKSDRVEQKKRQKMFDQLYG